MVGRATVWGLSGFVPGQAPQTKVTRRRGDAARARLIEKHVMLSVLDEKPWRVAPCCSSHFFICFEFMQKY